MRDRLISPLLSLHLKEHWGARSSSPKSLSWNWWPNICIDSIFLSDLKQVCQSNALCHRLPGFFSWSEESHNIGSTSLLQTCLSKSHEFVEELTWQVQFIWGESVPAAETLTDRWPMTFMGMGNTEVRPCDFSPTLEKPCSALLPSTQPFVNPLISHVQRIDCFPPPCNNPTGTGSTSTELEGKILQIIPEQSAPSAPFSNPGHCLCVSRNPQRCSTNHKPRPQNENYREA